MCSRRSSLELLSPLPGRNSATPQMRRLSVDLLKVSAEYKRCLNNLSDAQAAEGKDSHSVKVDGHVRDSTSVDHLQNDEDTAEWHQALNTRRRRTVHYVDSQRDEITDTIQRHTSRVSSACVSEASRDETDFLKSKTPCSGKRYSDEYLDIGTQERRRLILESANFTDHNMFNSNTRMRRASVSHMDSVVFPKISDCVSTARKVLLEIDKGKHKDVDQSNGLTAHYDAYATKKEKETSPGKLPDKWYEFKDKLPVDNVAGFTTNLQMLSITRSTSRCSLESLAADETKLLRPLSPKPIDVNGQCNNDKPDGEVQTNQPTDVLEPELHNKTAIEITISHVEPESRRTPYQSATPGAEQFDDDIQHLHKYQNRDNGISITPDCAIVNRNTRCQSLYAIPSEPKFEIPKEYKTRVQRMSLSDPFALPSIFQQQMVKIQMQDLKNQNVEEQRESPQLRSSPALSAQSSRHDSSNRRRSPNRSDSKFTAKVTSQQQDRSRTTINARTRSKGSIHSSCSTSGFRSDSPPPRKSTCNFGKHTEARINIRNNHSYQLKKHLSNMEKQLPTKTLLEIKRLKDLNKVGKNLPTKSLRK